MRLILFFLRALYTLIGSDFHIFRLKLMGKSPEEIEEYLDRRFIVQGGQVLAFGIKYSKITLNIEYAEGLSREAIPEQFLLVSNHRSIFDIPFFVLHFLEKNKLRFIGKKELGKGIPGLSNFVVYQHHLLIDRHGNMRETMQKIKEYVSNAKGHGYSLVIFPEGTRSKDGSILEFKTGGLKTFIMDSGLPILCATLDYKYPARTVKDLIKSNKVDCTIYFSKIIPPVSKDHTKEEVNGKILECETAIRDGLEYIRKNLVNRHDENHNENTVIDPKNIGYVSKRSEKSSEKSSELNTDATENATKGVAQETTEGNSTSDDTKSDTNKIDTDKVDITPDNK